MQDFWAKMPENKIRCTICNFVYADTEYYRTRRPLTTGTQGEYPVFIYGWSGSITLVLVLHLDDLDHILGSFRWRIPVEPRRYQQQTRSEVFIPLSSSTTLRHCCCSTWPRLGVVQVSFSHPPNPRWLMRYYGYIPRAPSSPIRRTSTMDGGVVART